MPDTEKSQEKSSTKPALKLVDPQAGALEMPSKAQKESFLKSTGGPACQSVPRSQDQLEKDLLKQHPNLTSKELKEYLDTV